jgi:ADP-ribose pyrophosphatase YjhB (NUDIX family)
MKTVYYESAGGVVIHNDAMLLLDRPSRAEVRLPKGHIDPGESPAVAALRETTEESGYAQLEIVQDLGVNDVSFTNGNREVVRTEHYFLLRLVGERMLRRDEKDAAQFAVLWVALEDAVARLTFEAEQDVAARAIAAYREMNSA